ncbi:hypothetical protein NXT08_22440 [Rhodococcus pyridinivorans]|uniref:hypothetical protein n=1 Tax=Rhodococcus pyridinivorans TaxID=103816 RepID=UPI0021641C41|nr:hypothetical protein [Rhodococcus pyridinivorans]UVT24963.1 hypothetical protein NXT08_22440 [Rhodococcus pyridinivorans]
MAEELSEAFRPSELGERGTALWGALSDGLADDSARLLLLAEACRMADSLDKLDQLLSGDVDAWTRVVTGDGEMVLRIDGAMAERRALVGMLRLTLRQIEGADEATPAGGDVVDALAAARAQRIADAAYT